MVELNSTRDLPDKMNKRLLSIKKKEITNPVGENSDHKWGLLRETWGGAIEGDYQYRSALPLSNHSNDPDHIDMGAASGTLLQGIWGGAIEGDYLCRSAPLLDDRISDNEYTDIGAASDVPLDGVQDLAAHAASGLKRPGVSFQKGTSGVDEGGNWGVGPGIRTDRGLQACSDERSTKQVYPGTIRVLEDGSWARIDQGRISEPK